MSHHTFTKFLLALLFVNSAPFALSQEPAANLPIEAEPIDSTETTESPTTEDESSYTDKLWENLQRWVDDAKSKGEDVSADTYEWTKRDFEAIGDWQYQIEEFENDISVEALQGRLNELGAERWELMWVQSAGTKTRYTFKRPTQSYIKNVPLSTLLKMMIPLSGSDSPGASE